MPNAWRYRVYVIAAFNQDKPYDQFIREQVAGDLLPHRTDQERADGLTATGLLVLGPTNYETQDKELLVTTTSSIPLRPRTTTPWPESSAARMC